MRIDITQGTYRALQHATVFRAATDALYPCGAMVVSSLGVLLALEHDEECRAAQWLHEMRVDRELIAASLPFEMITDDNVQKEHHRKTNPSIDSDSSSQLPLQSQPLPGNATQATVSDNKRAIDGSMFYKKSDLTGHQIKPRLQFFLDDDTVSVGWLEPSLMSAVFVAMQRLHTLQFHPLLATESLLFALALEEGSVGQFLREHQIDPAQLFERITQSEEMPTNIVSEEVIAFDDNNAPMQIDGHSSNVETDMQSLNTNVQPSSNRPETVVLRIIDASVNRAIEALRVIEDYIRFGLDDRHLTILLKEIRHELGTMLHQQVSYHEKLMARSTTTDIGTTVEGTNEYTRLSFDDVLHANFSRLHESLRSIEEYGKMFAPSIARVTERLRYRSYTLQKAVFATINSLKSFPESQLYLLVDARESDEVFTILVNDVIAAGIDFVQLRDKKIDDRRLLQRARLLRTLTSGTPTRMIINDRPDIAVLAHADGVHVGQEEFPVADVRRLVGNNMLIGVSTHNIEQARQAVLDGADYLGVGPTFPSTTKNFDQFPGTLFLKQVANEIKLPAFAIGGITLNNIALVMQTGIHRIALQSAITDSPKPGEMCCQLKSVIAKHL